MSSLAEPSTSSAPAGETPMARFGMVAKGNVARGHGWTLTTDFEGGNGEHVAVLSDSSAAWTSESDPGEDYDGGSYYTCCRITNERDVTRSITLEIRSHYDPRWNGWSMALGSPVLVIDEEADGADPASWRQIHAGEMETSAEVLRPTVEVPGGRSVCVSTFYWYPGSRVAGRLHAIAAARPADVRSFVAGVSAQGRPLLGLRLPSTTLGAPRVVLTGTTQASEGGQLPCLWALDHLLSPAGERWRRAFTFDVVPATNPDGTALGTCMTNSRGENPLFDARAAADGRESSAESAALWRLVSGGAEAGDAPAVGYLEYHYYFQTGRPCRPYVLSPSLFANEAQRAVYERTSAALVDLSEGNQIFVQPDHPKFSQSLIFVGAERFGLAGHLYKLNTILSAAECRAQAVAVLERYLEALLA